MKQFEIGKRYEMRSPCDYECIWRYIVAARTAQTITLQNEQGKITRHRINAKISSYTGCETVYPLGRYSLSPALYADRRATE